MKKILIIIVCILAIFTLNSNKIQVKSEPVQQDIASKIIRFHVIANSDSKSDQALKLKVRDKVLEYIQPKLKKSKSIEESRKIIRENDKQIIAIANKTIKDNGYSYSVITTLSNENFPIKTYGNITLPQGKYEAYRIIIGEGKGQNWWCVMFPPLCFVDITKGEVSYKETEAEMKMVLTPEEYEVVNNKTDKTKENGIKIKFKILELLKDKKNPAR
ncbi:stage II sporulation protein R [Clostridium sp. OS1-26]|uniref:stage II sporulation protein R n=1 Tax=Clostridium sp. OS1-26 TaxID=3070681 RepID=UPI0027E0B32B|nr:stage II sporulation protein R [Clostridium sp. OS1-26]WML36576.1 stage II sporulation protein R [Clostridium sp. OS1-26]